MAKNSMFVGKALSPEEATGLSNIAAICQEILQSQQQTGAPAEQEPEGDEGSQAQMSQYDNPKDPANEGGEHAEPDGDEDPKKKEFNEVKKKYLELKKAIETTPPDASDADMPPEEIQDEIETDETKKAVAAVAKALLGAIKPQAVRKTKDPVLASIEGIAKAVKVLSDRTDMTAEALGAIMSANGVFKQLEVVKKAQEKPAYKPVSTGADAAALMEYLAKGLTQQNVNQVQKSQNEQVGDECLDIVKSIFGGK